MTTTISTAIASTSVAWGRIDQQALRDRAAHIEAEHERLLQHIAETGEKIREIDVRIFERENSADGRKAADAVLAGTSVLSADPPVEMLQEEKVLLRRAMATLRQDQETVSDDLKALGREVAVELAGGSTALVEALAGQVERAMKEVELVYRMLSSLQGLAKSSSLAELMHRLYGPVTEGRSFLRGEPLPVPEDFAALLASFRPLLELQNIQLRKLPRRY
jgi:hypothetical protein